MPKSSSEKFWLWAHGAPRVLNQMTWGQASRGIFDHVYHPCNPCGDLKYFMCPNVCIYSIGDISALLTSWKGLVHTARLTDSCVSGEAFLVSFTQVFWISLGSIDYSMSGFLFFGIVFGIAWPSLLSYFGIRWNSVRTIGKIWFPPFDSQSKLKKTAPVFVF